jgi:hypothetical protein
MKHRAVLVSLLMSAALLHVGASDGQLVRGPTYEGAIFTPEMLPKPSARNPDPPIAGNIESAKATYWTPTAAQVRQFEAAFAKAFTEAQLRLPPPDARGDSVALKSGSRDWQKPLPADFDTNFLYHLDASCLTPKLKRQYIGVTVAGQRLLVANEAYNEKFVSDWEKAFFHDDDWPRQWFYIYDAGHQIFYDLATGKIWEVDT